MLIPKTKLYQTAASIYAMIIAISGCSAAADTDRLAAAAQTAVPDTRHSANPMHGSTIQSDTNNKIADNADIVHNADLNSENADNANLNPNTNTLADPPTHPADQPSVDSHRESNDLPENADSIENTNNNSQHTENADLKRSQSSPYAPLSDDLTAALQAIPWDNPPEVLDAIDPKNIGTHFYKSDEKHPELFRETIEGIDGAYIGVGTQGYLFTGWHRPRIAFMIDYDPVVVTLHKIYFLFWKHCDDSACLYKMFNKAKLGLELLDGEDAKAAGLSSQASHKIYRSARLAVITWMRQLKSMNEKTFMNDSDTYQYIRQMIISHRFITLQANLLGDKAFAGIADIMKQMGEEVGVLYLSNAEQYWNYTAQFKQNMINLPYAANAMILRTSATYPQNSDYRYSVQPASVFTAWLNHPGTAGVRKHTKRKHVKSPDDFPFVVDDRLPTDN